MSRIFILFPDPWPKKRQLKRRLISEETVSALARVLRSGGELRFASDSGDYAAQTLFLIAKGSAFAWLAERASDWRARPADWPETRYERKALAEGRKPVYLSFERL
jgi:tRNA (guanine-N7-)-methyltransferase